MTDEQPDETVEQTDNLLEQARKERELLQEQLDRKEALIKREEKLKAQELLKGRAIAGEVPEKPKEETPQEYKERVMRGDFNVRTDSNNVPK